MSGRGTPAKSKPGRYNDQALLDAWNATGAYPAIHNAIFDAAVNWLPAPEVAGPLLDLGCSIGMLGRRLEDVLGYTSHWTDGDTEALGRGIAAGSIDPARALGIQLRPDTAGEWTEFVTSHGIRTLVARRCLCVYSDGSSPAYLTELFADVGIERILLEGQRRDRRAVHPNGSADQQVLALSTRYTIRHGLADVRYLTLT